MLAERVNEWTQKLLTEGQQVGQAKRDVIGVRQAAGAEGAGK